MAGNPITVEELQILITANYGDAIRGMLKMVDRVKQIAETKLAPVQKTIQQAMSASGNPTEQAVKATETAATKTVEAVKKTAVQAKKSIDDMIAEHDYLNEKIRLSQLQYDIMREKLSGMSGGDTAASVRLQKQILDAERKIRSMTIESDKMADAIRQAENYASDMNAELQDSESKASKTTREAVAIGRTLDEINKKIQLIIDLLKQAEKQTRKLDGVAKKYRETLSNILPNPKPQIDFDRLLAEGDKERNKWGNTRNKSNYFDAYIKSLKNLNSVMPSTTKWFDKIKKSINSIGKILSKQFTAKVKEARNDFSRFKKMLASSVVFSAFYSAINGISNAIRDGTDNLYRYSKIINGTFATALDKASTAMQYLKNSVISAVSPIIERFAGAIDVAVDKTVEWINTLGQLIARVSGASTWTKAVKVQKEYAESASSAAKATKGMLAAFDEVNVIQNGQDTSDDTDYGSMFEMVETPTDVVPWLDRLKELITSYDWSGLGEYAAEQLNDALGNIDLSLVGEKLGASITSALETAVGFIESFDWEQLKQKVSDLIRGFFTGIEMPELGEGFVKVWELLADSITWVWENVFAPFGEWVMSDFAPIFGETLVSAVDLMRAALEKLQPVWDEVMKPIAEWVGEQLIKALEEINDLFGDLADYLNGKITFEELNEQLTPFQETLINIAQAIALVTAAFAVWKTLQPIINGVTTAVKIASAVIAVLSTPVGLAVAAIAGLIAIAVLLEEKYGTLTKLTEGLGELIKETWEEVKQAVSNAWVYIKPVLQSFLDFVGNNFASLFQSLNTMITGVIQVFKGLAEFLNGVFTGDWKKAINGLTSIFAGQLNTILAGIELLVNSFIDSLNWVGDLLSKVNSSWGWEIGKVSFKIDTVPEFAAGGVITSPTLGIMGEYAGASNNPEIVTPQNIMYDTVVEANAPLVSAMYDMVREIITAINDKDMTVEVDGDVVGSTAVRYIEKYKRITGKSTI